MIGTHDEPDRPPIRVVRIIARLNVGGPAIQAITLTRLLESLGYATTLLRGRESAEEGSMDYLAERVGVRPALISALRRDPSPRDVAALLALVRAIRRIRPALVHTHAAKGGTLGRLAALIAGGRRPVLVHTFHGHSLSGYFSSRTARFYLWIERFLARRTTRLVAVSSEIRDELVALGVAPVERFEVVRLGFDLSPFLVKDDQRSARRTALRAELGIPNGAQVVTLVARLVPIKRVDRFLRLACALSGRSDIHFLVAGDGELRDALRTSAEARALAHRLTWAGFRQDMPDVCFASDVVVLTSDNEGTPVSLIEAQAAAVPVVSTAVGGAATVVVDGQTGRLVPLDDEPRLAHAVEGILDDVDLAREMAAAGRAHVTATFALERLVADVDALYRRLLDDRGDDTLTR